MRHDPRTYLWDVQDAAESILAFIDGIELADYVASKLVQSAVERKFEIIGEALNQLLKANPDLARRIPELSRIIAFRNLLIHGYTAVDHARVWAIARDYLPLLRAAMARMLEELGS